MRALPALLLLMTCLSACVAPNEPDDTGAAPAPARYDAKGTLWLPPSQGSDRVRTSVSVPLGASPMRLETHLRLANSYFSVEIPQAMANVQVQLVAPAGPSAAQGTLDGNQPELVLEVPRASEGNWQLVLLSYGGSDAKSNGDRVDYDVRAEYAPEAKA